DRFPQRRRCDGIRDGRAALPSGLGQDGGPPVPRIGTGVRPARGQSGDYYVDRRRRARRLRLYPARGGIHADSRRPRQKDLLAQRASEALTARGAGPELATVCPYPQEVSMGTAAAKAVQHLHFELPPLPYAEDALAPVISAETLALHHGKHHKKYVDTMNELLNKEHVRGTSLEDVVRSTKGKLFNNAAQAWNHDFYWHSLSPKRLRPAGAMLRRVESDFGSYDQFAEKLAKAAADQFGSGWAWLVEKDGTLQITTTWNADTP